MNQGIRLARAFVVALLAGLLAGIVLLVMVPVAMGWRPYTVLTGSMRPNIQPGDVVMDQPIRAPEIHVGDVVTFSDPSRQGRLVTHRVRSVAHSEIFTTVETRGDANNTSERWQVQTKDRVGRVVFVLPKVGHVANLVRNPAGVLILVVLPVLGLGFLALRSIWRDDEDDDEPDPDAEPDDQPELPFDAQPDPVSAEHGVADAAARPGR
ncbi:MAG: signal peptidase I [Solirubrobacteraceae bacterium]|nr:signal peptidase I [Solirubrobacteraceae bacterium]